MTTKDNMKRIAAVAGIDLGDRPVAHSIRFRQVANGYARRVSEAYDWDLARAMADSDEQVAETVGRWEDEHVGYRVDWAAIGASEHDPDDA
jgi:hypothetical protein